MQLHSLWGLVCAAADIHGALLRRLKAKFPKELWQYYEPSAFWYFWVAYSQAWEAILAEWDAGELSSVQPRGWGRWPFEGLKSSNQWSLQRGEARQRELIGMTAEADLPVEVWGNRMLGTSPNAPTK
eukprot:SAG31_NODE_5050_length_2775_cov_2.843423_1_plen_127_part_00